MKQTEYVNMYIFEFINKIFDLKKKKKKKKKEHDDDKNPQENSLNRYPSLIWIH